MRRKVLKSCWDFKVKCVGSLVQKREAQWAGFLKDFRRQERLLRSGGEGVKSTGGNYRTPHLNRGRIGPVMKSWPCME